MRSTGCFGEQSEASLAAVAEVAPYSAGPALAALASKMRAAEGCVYDHAAAAQACKPMPPLQAAGATVRLDFVS